MRSQSPSAAGQLGRELRRLRMGQGLSQRAFVRALGLTAHSNLVEYELGRRIPPGDIIAVYERLFGSEARSLRQLLAAALADRAAAELERPARPDLEEAEPRGAVPVPRMLPPGVADFVGRRAEVDQLTDLAASSESSGTLIAVISGTAGVGKTALAVHVARRVGNRFPDGQLHLDLRGFSTGPPLLPVRALASLLAALGVAADAIPTDLDQAVGLYRSLLAERRVLLLLDNAHRAEQVRPLLPAGSGCLALVTSRDRLAGLIARDGARRLTLDPLSPPDAARLLARIVGGPRVAAEPDAVAELAALCAYLPLAVRIAAANLADQPRRDIAGYVAQVRAESPLTVLAVDGDESGVMRTAFDASYLRLDADAQRLFRRLGLNPAADATVPAAAALAGLDRRTTARLLRRLTAVHLAEEPVPGRFGAHDLLRRYAEVCAEVGDTPDERRAAVNRLYDWYLRRADAAARLLSRGIVRLPGPPPVGEGDFADRDAALAWLDTERPNLVAAIGHAADHGPRPAAWRLADALRGYFCLRLHTVDWLAVAEAALRAARAESEPWAEVAAHLSLANCHLYQSRYDRADDHAVRGLRLARETGWREAEAAMLDTLGTVRWQAGRLGEAARAYAAALAINEETGWRFGQATNLSNLGLVYQESGQLDLAVEHFSRALAVDEQLDSRSGMAITLSNLGEAYHASGQLDRAHAHLTRALELCRELGDVGGEANALYTLAAVDLDCGRVAEADNHARAAVELAAASDDPRVEADARNVLGAVLVRRGDQAGAGEQYRRALEIAARSDNRAQEVTALVGLSGVERDLGHEPTALTLARRALRLARAGGFTILAEQARAVLGRA
jgi:tetratricopeptide (TPR) repeat protein/transcriptional regulator with XRE-family HTH domain